MISSDPKRDVNSVIKEHQMSDTPRASQEWAKEISNDLKTLTHTVIEIKGMLTALQNDHSKLEDRVKTNEERLEKIQMEHDNRLDELREEMIKGQTSINTLRWVGGVVTAALGLIIAGLKLFF